MKLGSRPTICRARNPETPKSLKSLPRGVWDPQTVPKTVRKVQKIVDLNYFWTFGLFSELFGGPGRRVPNSSRETFGVSGSVDGRGDPKKKLNPTRTGDRFLSSAGPGKNCAPSMRVPNPSPVLDKNRAPMGPEILSSTRAGVRRKASKAFPDSSSALDKSEQLPCRSAEVKFLSVFSAKDVVKFW